MTYRVVLGSATMKNRRVVECESLTECRDALRKYITDEQVSGIYGYGYGDEGIVVDANDKIIGKFSYNGRLWKCAGKKVNIPLATAEEILF